MVNTSKSTAVWEGAMPEQTAKTSLALPPDLWRRVRIRAVEEGRTASELVIEALTTYLTTKPKVGRKGGARDGA
jgi:hypothetical protein